MTRFLADECCPRVLVTELRAIGHDVLYAAETERRAADLELLDRALAENRFLVTEDFDFGELVMRDGRPTMGVIVLYLPKSGPAARANRLLKVIEDPAIDFSNALTIVSERRVRQRRISPTSAT